MGMSSALMYSFEKIIEKITSHRVVHDQLVAEYYPSCMYVPDALLGYSTVPGIHNVTFTKQGSISRVFTMTINPDGDRITSFNPELYLGKKEIWIFGDSFIVGLGNNDETSFPFFLQHFLPQFRIVNYAVSGYGNIQAYLKIKKNLDDGKNEPSCIIIGYGDYYNSRNVAATSWLRSFVHSTVNEMDMTEWTYPRAFLDNDKLNVTNVPLFSWSEQLLPPHNPDQKIQVETTKKILSEILYIAEKRKIRTILAFILGTDNDQVVQSARGMGYFVCDLRAKNSLEWDDFSPLDGHPGPLAQNIYAIKLFRAVYEINAIPDN